MDGFEGLSGGFFGTDARFGYVDKVLFDTAGNNTIFCIQATIFNDTGTVGNPIIDWLAVQTDPIQVEPVARFGWKTTPPEHPRNDDAC